MYPTMAKKRQNIGKTPAGRARERGETIPVTLEFRPELDAALERCMNAERRTKKAIVELALEAYLAERKFWPPA